MTDVLRAENISKSYGGVSALKNVSFAVRPGEVHALMGENGAGKSTLIKILAGAAKPDAGRILLNGQPASIHNPLDSQGLGWESFTRNWICSEFYGRREHCRWKPELSGTLIVNFRRIDSFCRPFLEQVGFARSTRAIPSRLDGHNTRCSPWRPDRPRLAICCLTLH